MRADKLLTLVDQTLESDGGASFRESLGRRVGEVGDAYRGREPMHRPRLGASGIGHPCSRYLWYQYRWAFEDKPNARLLRIFNRGHLEEARFAALLDQVPGLTAILVDASGKQFRQVLLDDRFTVTADGFATGIPDCAPDTTVLLEFKTHRNSTFKELVRCGLREANHRHFIQCVVGMHAHNVRFALYLAVNKDNDELYAELIPEEPEGARKYLERAQMILEAPHPPPRVSDNPTWWECKICPARAVCHGALAPETNCRTCLHVWSDHKGRFACNRWGTELSLEAQEQGCVQHTYYPGLLNSTQHDAREEDGAVEVHWRGRTFLHGPEHVTSATLRSLPEDWTEAQ